MTRAIPALHRSLRPLLVAICFGLASAVVAQPALARGPEAVADVAEKVIDAVVNISTSQTVEAKDAPSPGDRKSTMPKLPPGSPFEEFFDDFKNRHGGGDKGLDLTPHKTVSLGSGFIIDTSGIVVTNNHVIDGADEINVIMNDGNKYKESIVGIDKKTDLAVVKL